MYIFSLLSLLLNYLFTVQSGTCRDYHRNVKYASGSKYLAKRSHTETKMFMAGMHSIENLAAKIERLGNIIAEINSVPKPTATVIINKTNTGKCFTVVKISRYLKDLSCSKLIDVCQNSTLSNITTKFIEIPSKNEIRLQNPFVITSETCRQYDPDMKHTDNPNNRSVLCKFSKRCENIRFLGDSLSKA